MDSLREWGKEYNIEDSTEETKKWLDLSVKFRPSQQKFKTSRTFEKLEIVKYSSPISIALNRPIINILDQVLFLNPRCQIYFKVSGMQNSETHYRIANRIHNLMDIHLNNLMRSLIEEQKARNKLGEFPKLIIYEQLTDLNLTNEPFFRSMIRAAVRSSLSQLLINLI